MIYSLTLVKLMLIRVVFSPPDMRSTSQSEQIERRSADTQKHEEELRNQLKDTEAKIRVRISDRTLETQTSRL